MLPTVASRSCMRDGDRNLLEVTQPIDPHIIERQQAFRAMQYSRNEAPDFFDPVLNVDWFEMRSPTFPEHPHAGFSAVTYIFADSPGGFINKDSLGNELMLPPGSLHWSRAGRGMTHEETPAQAVPVHGLQIFMNLPSQSQLDPPAAFHISPDQVLVQMIGPGISQRIAANGNAIGETKQALPSPVFISETRFEEAGKISVAIEKHFGGILIQLDGRCEIEGELVETKQAIAFRNRADHAAHLDITGIKGARIALICGRRLEQPVIQKGPLMMARADMLDERIAAYGRGEFGRIPRRD